MELGWVRDNDLTVGADDYLRLVLKKTAWYSFIHPMRIGALVANGDDQNLSRFDRFGYLLGLAFQITDDVLNLNGEVTRLRQGDRRRSLGRQNEPFCLRTHSGTPVEPIARGSVASWRGRASAACRARCLRLHQIIASGGSIQWAQQAAAAFADAATREFHGSAFAGVPASPDLEWLRACIDFLVQRDA